MILGNQEILTRVKQDSLIENFNISCLQPASYDLTLGKEFLFLEHGQEIRLDKKPKYFKKQGDKCLLNPGEFCLGTTIEKVNLPIDLVGRVEGRSSFARIGLLVHCVAGFCDPGFTGQITLEFANLSPNPILLKSGIRIAQIAFEKVVGCELLYDGKYQNQIGATGSKVYLDKQ